MITEVAGTEIKTAEQLQKAVAQSQIERPSSITVRRGEQTQKLSLRPQELQKATD